jgi:hypothetical protein
VRRGIGIAVAVSAMSLVLGAGTPTAFAAASTGRATTTSASSSAVSRPLLPATQRNCGTVTCSFYFSKSETVDLKKRLDEGGTQEALNALCAALGVAGGRAGPICAALAANHALKVAALERHVNAAVSRRGCAVVRHNFLIQSLPYSLNAAAISFGNVAGNHKFCGP